LSSESDSSKPPETALQELKQQDTELQNEVQVSTEIKVCSTCNPEYERLLTPGQNEFTRLSVTMLGHISLLNTTLLLIPLKGDGTRNQRVYEYE
jgi:hypothetical protein